MRVSSSIFFRRSDMSTVDMDGTLVAVELSGVLESVDSGVALLGAVAAIPFPLLRFIADAD